MKQKLLSILLLTALAFSAQAQCPNFTNITAAGVEAFTGDTDNPFMTSGVVNGRHTVINTPGTDPNTGGALQLLPAGESEVIRLGNQNVGAEAEALTYSFTVDKNNPVLLVKFAVVMEDPGHASIEQPRFIIRITDQHGTLVEDCAEYDVYARPDIPGFQSYQLSSWQPVRWRDWTNVGLDMSRFAGQTVQVQFITYDCAARGHFGYAYFTAKCIPNRLQLESCAGGSFTLEAPENFESYLWSNGETTRTATFNTAAVNNSQISCTVTSATGCQFPLYAFVTTNSGAVQAGDFTDVICEGETYVKHNFNLPPQEAGEHFYQNVIVNPATCSDDEEINLTLTVVQRTTYFREAICHGDSYNANGFNVEEPPVGVFRDTIKTGTVNGCDTYNVLELTVSANLNMPNIIQGETQPCTGEIFTYTFAGAESLTRFEWVVPANATLYKSNRFMQTIQLYFTNNTPAVLQLKGENGCGSGTAQLNIAPRQSYSIQLNEAVCRGENFDMHNFNLGRQDSVGYFVYSKHLSSSPGCDSVVTLALSVLPKPEVRIEPKDTALCNPGEEITLWALTGDMEYPGTPSNETNTSDVPCGDYEDWYNTLTPADGAVFGVLPVGSVYAISSYSGAGGKVIIPSHIMGKVVGSFYHDAFAYLNITEVVIPPTIDEIISAFRNLPSLTYITIPSTVTLISNLAFDNSPNVIIRCYKNSTAHHYAQVNNIKFELIDDCEEKAFCLDVDYEDWYNTLTPNNEADFTATLVLGTSDCIITSPGYVGPGGKVVIPTTINGNTIFGIAATFSDENNITEVVVPPTVTQLFAGVFSNYSQQTYITIPKHTNVNTGAIFNSPNIIIRCYENSSAHQYAIDNNIKFELIEECNTGTAGNEANVNIYDCDLNYLWNTGSTDGAITVKPTTTTEYSVVVTTQNGCSSEAKQTVIVNTNAPQTVNATICQGEIYTDYGLNETVSGSYNVSLPNGDCSIPLTVNLTVAQPFVTTITDQVCAGEVYQNHGWDIILIEPGVFKDTLRYASVAGCDSIVALEITVLPDQHTVLYDTVCQNEIYNKNGFNLSKQEIAGAFTHTLEAATAQNCEHHIMLKLLVNPVYENIISDEVKQDSAYTKYGFNFPKVTKDTTAIAQLTSVSGCDSTVVLNLKVTAPPVDCSVDGTILFREDFGGNSPSDPDYSTTPLTQCSYTFASNGDPRDSSAKGRYAIRKKSWVHTPWYSSIDDVTFPADNTRGYLMQIDASATPGTFYETQIDDLCPGTHLYFSVWGMSAVKNAGYANANLKLVIETTTGVELAAQTVMLENQKGYWEQFGMSFVVPAGETSAKFRIVNNSSTGSGNDFMLDDVEIRFCTPPIEVKPALDTVCVGGTLKINSTFKNNGIFIEPLEFRWLKSETGNLKNQNDWISVGGNSATLTINNVVAADSGYYRLAIASQGGIALENCRAMSEPVFLMIDENCCKNDTARIDATILVGEDYTDNGFSIPVQTAVGTVHDTLRLPQTQASCDSIVILELEVIDATTSGDYFQVLTCYPAAILDVFANDTSKTTCNRAGITLTITSGSQVGATTLVDGDNNIIYTYPDGFIGHDVLEYTVQCPSGTYTEKVFLTIGECPDNIDDPDCFRAPLAMNFGIEELARSTTEVSLLTNPLIGDVDGDGEIEILVINHAGSNSRTSYSNAIHVYGFEKATNTLYLKYKITVPVNTLYPSSALAIAKVDGNPYASIFYTSNPDRKLYKFDFNGVIPTTFPSTTSWTQSWATVYTNNTAYVIVAPVIADIMGSGRTQVVMLNKVIDTRSGRVIAEGAGMIPTTGRSTTHSFAWFGHGNGTGYESCPVVTDIDGDGIQELIGGDCVYGINLTDFDNLAAGNTFTLKQRASSVGHSEVGDGGTAVADIDNDEQLEVIVAGPLANNITSNTGTVYVYNPRTGAVIHNNRITDIPRAIGTSRYGPSRPFIGDFDADQVPEIALTGINTLRSYKYDTVTQQLNQFWTLSTTDQSGSTTLTVFDFAHDGKSRLVYRDETQLRIIDASTNPPTVDAFFNNTESPTVNEFPVIADVNNDGAAEIIVTGVDRAVPQWIFRGEVRVYASKEKPWAPARKVWNQAAYNVVNVNEDLTIPRYPMNPARVFPNGKQPFNNFLQQQTLLNTDGDPYWPLVDIIFAEEPEATASCDSVIFTGCITNQGDAVLQAPIYVTFYKNDTIPANIIALDSIQTSLPANDTLCYELTLRNIQAHAPLTGIWISINDHKGEYPYQAQCADVDGRREIPMFYNLPVDDTICAGDSIAIGNQYYKLPGTHCNTIETALGYDSVVTINLTILPTDTIRLQDTISVGESYLENGFSIPVQTQAGTVYDTLHLQNQSLCDSLVMLKLEVVCAQIDTTRINDTIFVGEGYNTNGFTVPVQNSATTIDDTLRLKNQYLCDSTVILNLDVLCISDTIRINDSIFVGEDYNKYGFTIPTQNAEIIIDDTLHLQSQYLCDSTVILNLKVLCLNDTLIIKDSIFVGDSYNKHGFAIPVQTAETTLLDTVRLHNRFACDSTVILDLKVQCILDTTRINETIFIGEDYNKNGFNIPTQYVQTTIDDTLHLKNQYLCDSTVILNLKVLCSTADTTHITDSIFAGEDYTENGFSIPVQNHAGTVRDTLRLQNISLCDSTVVLKLTVFPVVSKVLCESDLPFTFRDTTFAPGTLSGKYIIDKGKSSMTALELTVNPTPQFSIVNSDIYVCGNADTTEIIAGNFIPAFDANSRIQWTVINEYGDRSTLPDKTSPTMFTNAGLFPHVGEYRIEAVYEYLSGGIQCASNAATIHYTIMPPPNPPIIASKVMCQGEVTPLQAFGSPLIQWISTDGKLPDWTGDTYDFNYFDLTDDIEAGKYEFELYDIDAVSGCESERVQATFEIAPGAQVEIVGNDEFCHHAIEEMYEVTEAHEESLYFWRTSGKHYNYSKDPYSAVCYVDWNGAGIDTLMVTERTWAGCEDSDTLVVAIADYPVAYYTWSLPGANTTIEFTDSSYQAPIMATAPDGTRVEIPLTYTMEWFFDTADNRDTSVVDMQVQYSDRFKPIQVHDYTYGYKYPILSITNNYGCKARYVTPIFVDIPIGIYIPNAFSPTNAAASVRVFQPVAYNLEYLHMWIYDKWGNLLHYSDEVHNGLFTGAWDGTYNGELLKSDVYVWKIEAGFKNGTSWPGQKKPLGGYTHFGNVVLIR